MKLAAADVSALDGGGELGPVFGGGDHALVTVRGIEGVDKVYAVSLFDMAEEGAFAPGKAQGVPADVRDFVIRRDHFRDGAHLTGDEAEPRVLAVFIALIKQELHPEADAHEGLAASRLVDHDGIQPGCPQLVGGVPEGSDAGQEDLVGTAQHFGLAGDDGLRPDGGEGALEREEIAHAVVHNGDHPRTPLVEGSSSAQAGSMATALRRERAKDLKQPSMIW